MNIAIVTPEVVPFSKSGGLADVCGALAPEFKRQGHNVIVVSPFYRNVREKHKDMQTAFSVDVVLGGEKHTAQIKQIEHENVSFYFVDIPLFYDRDGLYGKDGVDFPDNNRRFIAFSLATLQVIRKLKFSPAVIHCHDWQAALIPVYLKNGIDSEHKDIRSVLTIHNMAYQGLFPPESMRIANLDWKLFNWKQLEFYGNMNFLKGGIVFADAITTVSKTYSCQIMSREFGCGLDGVLRERANVVHGIINAVDYTIWNPETDKLIPHNYSLSKLTGKAKCKKELCARLGIKDEKAPLFSFIGRLVSQKGVDLIADAFERLHGWGCNLIYLGTGDKKIEEQLATLTRKYPGTVSGMLGYDEALAHKIYAGSDFLLMPSRFEPCGLNQMYAMRYGTIPIVTNTGGLADTVKNYVPGSTDATGVVIDSQTSAALQVGLLKALAIYKNAALRKQLISNCMKQLFTWAESAKQYITLFRTLTGTKE